MILKRERSLPPQDDAKRRAKYLFDTYGCDQDVARKIWAFSPENSGPNIVINATKVVQYLNEIKDL